MTVIDLPTVRTGDVWAVEQSLRVLLESLDPDAVPTCEATDLWTAFDVVERLAGSAKVLLTRRVEDAAAWKRAGFRSCAEQLAASAGSSVGAARGLLETSKLVAGLPATAAALRSGVLSGPKVRAIADAADVAPAAETDLLKTAHGSLGELRDACLRAKAAVDRDKTHERIRRERRARDWSDAEGAWNLSVRGTPEAGALFRSVHEPIVDEIFKAARADGRNDRREVYAFDAFIELINRAAGKHVADADAKPKPTPARFMALLRVDAEALRRGTVEGEEVCEITGLGPIPVASARDILGEAVLKLVITKGVDVAHITHLGRSATVAQKVALWWQAPQCQDKTCTRTGRLEDDHHFGWANTHETRLDGLKRLCGHHHWLKTHLGWELAVGEGPQPMVPPDDPRHPIGRPPDP